MGILEKIKNLFKSNQQENIIENLEDILLESDINNEIVIDIINKLTKEKNKNEKTIIEKLKELLSNYINIKKFNLENNKLNILLIVGINGIEKTSSIAKLANKLKMKAKYINIRC